jgi:hypothetical protein
MELSEVLTIGSLVLRVKSSLVRVSECVHYSVPTVLCCLSSDAGAHPGVVDRINISMASIVERDCGSTVLYHRHNYTVLPICSPMYIIDL